MSKADRHVGSSLDDFYARRAFLKRRVRLPSKRRLPSRCERQ
jgi:hypothetical protein